MDMPAPLSHTAYTVRMMPPAQTSKSNGSKRHGGGHCYHTDQFQQQKPPQLYTQRNSHPGSWARGAHEGPCSEAMQSRHQSRSSKAGEALTM